MQNQKNKSREVDIEESFNTIFNFSINFHQLVNADNDVIILLTICSFTFYIMDYPRYLIYRPVQTDINEKNSTF